MVQMRDGQPLSVVEGTRLLCSCQNCGCVQYYVYATPAKPTCLACQFDKLSIHAQDCSRFHAYLLQRMSADVPLALGYRVANMRDESFIVDLTALGKPYKLSRWVIGRSEKDVRQMETQLQQLLGEMYRDEHTENAPDPEIGSVEND